MKNWIVVSLVVAALTATGVVSAFSQSHGDEQGEGYLTGCVEDLLTEEQNEALSEMIQELKDAGASSEEIREAVQQVLEELGINTEDCDKHRHRYEGYINDCVADQLTEEQKEALSEMIEELKDAGASSEEIREAVHQALEELGIDTEDCDKRRHRYEGYINDCVADQLTEEQKEALSEMIQELKDAGASSEEIREAVQQALEELGINTEKCQGAKGSKGTTGFKRNRA